MLKGLDHVNVSTQDMEATLAFYEETFGLIAKAAPGQDRASNSWLYNDAGRAIVHVNLRKAGTADGPINHIAFECVDFDSMQEKLIEAGHKLAVMDNRDVTGCRQIFLRSPEGARVELTFHEA